MIIMVYIEVSILNKNSTRCLWIHGYHYLAKIKMIAHCYTHAIIWED